MLSTLCEGPYLELLGSEGKKERHRVREKEMRREDREILFKYVEERQVDKLKDTVKVK